MSSGRFSISYVEEDGFPITRGDDVFMVYGTCEGEYSWYHSAGRMYMSNGDPGYPEESEIERESFDCWIDTIELDEFERDDIELTDDEMSAFKTHMADKLQEAAWRHGCEDDEDW